MAPGKPPPGGDQNRGWQLLATHSTLSGIAVALVVARLYTRIVVVESTGLEDYSIVLAVVRKMLTSRQIFPHTETSY